MTGSRVIDVHTHIVPPELIDLADRREAGLSLEYSGSGERAIRLNNGFTHPVSPVFSEVQARLGRMDRDGIDAAVLSVSPSLILPIEDAEDACEACRAANDGIAAFVAQAPGRLYGMASIPLADSRFAVEELERTHRELGLVGVQLGTSHGEMMLDDEELEPVLAALDAMQIPVMLHPYRSMVEKAAPGLDDFHLANVIGNPSETFLAASRLMLGGVLDRHPRLRFLLVHGGGGLPFQLGRLVHAQDARASSRAAIQHDPRDYLGRFYFDTVLFDPKALAFLVSIVGSERVIFGSDTPFDMADLSAIEGCQRLGDDTAKAILSRNAGRAFGVDSQLANSE